MFIFGVQIERFKTGGGQYKKSMNHLSEQIIAVIEDRNTPLFNAHNDDYGYADWSDIYLYCCTKVILSFTENLKLKDCNNSEIESKIMNAYYCINSKMV